MLEALFLYSCSNLIIAPREIERRRKDQVNITSITCFKKCIAFKQLWFALRIYWSLTKSIDFFVQEKKVFLDYPLVTMRIDSNA